MRGLKPLSVSTNLYSLSRIFYRCVDWNRSRSMMNWKGVKVASFTDAWIETAICRKRTIPGTCRIFYRCVDWNYKDTPENRRKGMSHLLQMRGLKRTEDGVGEGIEKSHLLQMRGLKPLAINSDKSKISRIFYRCVDWNTKFTGSKVGRNFVASFTDAWIET